MTPIVVAGLSESQASLPHGFVLRCADVHPIRCAVTWRSSTVEGVVARARDHGESAHDFTPVWYTRERVASMGRAVTTG